MKEVVVTLNLTKRQKSELEALAKGYRFTYTTQKEVTAEMLKKTEVTIGNVPALLLRDAKDIRFVQLDSAGVEPYIVPGILDETVKLCNASGAYGTAMTEFMIAELLFLMKNLGTYHDQRKVRYWNDVYNVRVICGSRVLVLGAGSIGRTFAERMHAFGARVVGIRRHKTEVPPYMEALFSLDDLDEQLKKADIVACVLPNTKKTRGLLTEERLKKMKKDAILLNFGRGTLVDPEDLAKALRKGWIGGAAIDVTDPEPLPENSSLWDAPNLILTPHASGGCQLPLIRDAIFTIARDNLTAYMNGEPMRNEVDRKAGYRKFTP